MPQCSLICEGSACKTALIVQEKLEPNLQEERENVVIERLDPYQ